MAQKQQQYEDAADSIFNFIFAGARRNMRAAPPKNLKGVAGDEMAYALGEVALSPAVYANEELLGILGEPLDAIQIMEIKTALDKRSLPVKIGVSAKNLSEFATDPESFVEKIFQRSADHRKRANAINRARGLGGIMDLGIGAVAARAAGHSSLDSIKMGKLLGNERIHHEHRNNWALELATSASAFETGAARGWDYDTTEKISRNFSILVDASYNKVSAIGTDTEVKEIVKKKLQSQGFALTQGDIDTLWDKYKERRDKYVKNGKVKMEYGEWNLGEMNKDIRKKQQNNINYASGPDEWMKSQSPADKLRALKFEELQAKINLLPANDPKRAGFQRDLNLLQTWQISNGPKMKWSRWTGEAYVNITTLNDYILKGGGLAAVLSGDFFDNKRNNLSPSKAEKVKIYAFDGGNEEVEIFTPRDDMNRPYATMTGLYYLTPRSLIRTFLVNGEGFVYLAYLRQEKMRKMIRGSDSLYKYVENSASANRPDLLLLSGITTNFARGDQQGILAALAADGNYEKVIKELLDQRNLLLGQGLDFTDPELINLLEELQKHQGKLKNSLALRYGAKLRGFFNKISPKVWLDNLRNKLLTRVLGNRLGGKVIKWLFDSGVALKALVRRGVKMAIHAIFQSLGLAIGGVANALIYVLTEAAYFIAEKLFKPFFKIAMFFLWGIPLLFFFMFVSGLYFLNPFNIFGSNNDRVDTASYVPPTDCEECAIGDVDDEDESPYPPDDDDDDDGEMPEPPPPVSGAVCPLLDSSSNPAVNIHCSQGPSHGKEGYSHFAENAIDITNPSFYWSAPTELQITRSDRLYKNSGGQKCGGIVHAYSAEHGVTYILIHVVPYVAKGDTIQKGEIVAKMSQRGDDNIEFRDPPGSCATGPHFHLEVSGSNARADDYYRQTLCCDINKCWPNGTPKGVPPGCGSGEGSEEGCEDFKTFSGVDFKNLGDRIIGISSSSKPSITGNSQVDENIRAIAERRGYKPRNDGGGLKGGVSSAYSSMAEALKKEENLTLALCSEYRSYAGQRDIFLGRLDTGCRSNISPACDATINDILRLNSAPGYSKHHTGYAVDFKCGSCAGNYQDFRSSGCYKWLSEDNYCNAKKFGFIPSYPNSAGNQGPDPEEWEYIYVGVDNFKK